MIPLMPHDHSHDDGPAHALLPSDPALRVKALETILAQKGLIDPAALDEIIDTYENKHRAAQWCPCCGAGLELILNFRRPLLEDATSCGV